MSNSKRISRRRFLFLGGGTAASVFLGGGFLASGCPLSNSGVCVGPCAAFLDLNGDGICDRIQRPACAGANASCTTLDCVACVTGTSDQSPDRQTAQRSSGCPFGLVNDPYPGQCGRYVDANGNGLCDLSEGIEPAAVRSGGQDAPQDSSSGNAVPPALPPTPQVTRQPSVKAVACPFGFVDDPYPGKCRRYVDANGNRLCDLSEVTESRDSAGSTSPSAPAPAVTPQPTPGAERASPSVACPFGLVNDPYPGRCRRYVDANGNRLCDLSEPGKNTLPAPQLLGGQSEQPRRQRRGRESSSG